MVYQFLLKMLGIKPISVLLILLISSEFTSSQTEIYKSDFPINNNQLGNFYSTFQITNKEIVFNCNNYNLYCIGKDNLKTNWSTYLGRKSNTGLFIRDSLIFTTQSKNDKEEGVIISLNNGAIKHLAPFKTIETEPYYSNNIMYCSGVKDFGQLFAYDIINNKIIWDKFIAHGISKTPFYNSNYIVCNAEADNWFYIDYNGNLIDTVCKEKFDGFVEGIPCTKRFLLLSHDESPITTEYIAKKNKDFSFDDYVFFQSEYYTAILDHTYLIIFGNKKKIIRSIQLNKLVTKSVDNINNIKSILKIESDYIWFYSHQKLIKYDIKIGKLIDSYDLAKWNAHQIALDNNTIWLISNNDGQVYRLKL